MERFDHVMARGSTSVDSRIVRLLAEASQYVLSTHGEVPGKSAVPERNPDARRVERPLGCDLLRVQPRSATVCQPPAEMPAQFVASPMRVGAYRVVVVPSPNLPLALLPQHHRV